MAYESPKASIDIGTNTVLLLVGQFSSQDTIKVLHEKQRLPRLGRGVDRSRKLSADAMDRVIACVQEYKQFIAHDYPELESITVTATSAVRDAGNRDQFIQRVRDETGLDIRLLSGEEEAMFTYRGALSVLEKQEQPSRVVIDIGGGSTEIALGKGRVLQQCHSFDTGCVRFTEQYLDDDPPAPSRVKACREAISSLFQQHPFDIDTEDTALIGVAGTVTSVAFMELELQRYVAAHLNGQSLEYDTVQKWIGLFESRPSSSFYQQYPAVMEGRADIFLAGLLILEQFMKLYEFPRLTVSTGGIRHGAILSSE